MTHELETMKYTVYGGSVHVCQSIFSGHHPHIYITAWRMSTVRKGTWSGIERRRPPEREIQCSGRTTSGRNWKCWLLTNLMWQEWWWCLWPSMYEEEDTPWKYRRDQTWKKYINCFRWRFIFVKSHSPPYFYSMMRNKMNLKNNPRTQIKPCSFRAGSRLK